MLRLLYFLKKELGELCKFVLCYAGFRRRLVRLMQVVGVMPVFEQEINEVCGLFEVMYAFGPNPQLFRF